MLCRAHWNEASRALGSAHEAFSPKEEQTMQTDSALQATIDAIVQNGKGLLAADESGPTIAKRFKSIDVESTEENRRAWRELLLSTPGLAQYVSGVILYEETLGQCAAGGEPLPSLAARQGIVPGIKVDTGKIPLAHAEGDEITQGLDGLAARLEQYKAQGARFAKWRAVYNVSDTLPSRLAIEANAESLARYAAICQAAGVVPIVEPEVLMDGGHSIDRCAQVTEAVLHEVFHALHRHGVALELMLLKPSMVLAGKAAARAAGVSEVAARTVSVLGRTVPPAVAGIYFLSGGQTPVQASAHLDAINRTGRRPWPLSFSYGRALQEPPLEAWRGKAANVGIAQQALLKRAKLNGAATRGCYAAQDEATA